MNKNEVIYRLFMSYGNMIQLETDLEEYEMGEYYTFSKRNPVTNEKSKTIKVRLCDILFRNVYWMEAGDINFDKFPELKENKDVVFNLPIDNTCYVFKPKYISEDKKSIGHYFDRSYFTGTKENRPREILYKIFNLFEENDILLYYSEFSDYL